MSFIKNLILCCAVILLISLGLSAQNTVLSPATAVVPRLVNFSGKAMNGQGQPIAGTIGITFSIYAAQDGGSPLWTETQNVRAYANGHYSVQLGATTSEGLPLDLFVSGEARWLGVRVNGGEEQPRVLLLSVPYALKAADAQTLGGLPASAFALAAPSGSSAPAAPASSPSSGSASNIGGSGTQDYIPLWTDNNGDLGNSILYQLGTGSTAKIGINEKSPLFTLDVNGQELVRGLFEMATTNYASKTKGYDSQPLNFESSAFSSTAGAYTLNHFQWQAEPTGNNTTTPGATLNLLYGTDPNQPTETGLNIASSGQIAFAKGQTFPGTGTITGVATASGSGLSGGGTNGSLNLSLVNTCAKNQVLQWSGSAWACSSAGAGTITGVTAGTGLSGGGVSGNVTLNVDTTKVPQLNTANTFTAGNEFTVGSGTAVVASTNDQLHAAILAQDNSFTTTGVGLYGNSGDGTAVLGNSANGVGVTGQSGGTGVYGIGYFGVTAQAENGEYGLQVNSDVSGAVLANGSNTGNSAGLAGYFVGDVVVTGSVMKAGGNFKIDHPLDPANKYLYHSFVESPDMMNIYNGNITTDSSGMATITLPDWFGALNKDFRYQLTVIGQFAQAIVAHEIENNQFQIKTSLPGVKVSWQVTGIRQDAWANAHRSPVEQEKEAQLKGFYLHPELYGASPEKQIEWALYPQLMKKMQQSRQEVNEKKTRLTDSGAATLGSTE